MKAKRFVQYFILSSFIPALLVISFFLVFGVRNIIFSDLVRDDAAQYSLSEIQDAKDFIFSTGTTVGEVDHDIYYNDILGLMDSVNNSQIVIIGDSRSLYGFDYSALKLFSDVQRQHVFNLAFGYAEGSRFYEALIRKNNIRNKLLLVQADIFGSDMSAQGRKALDTHPFTALQSVLRKNIQWSMHLLCKKFLKFKLYAEDQVWYRSTTNGALWRYEAKTRHNVDPTLVQDLQLTTAEKDRIDAFKKLADAHGLAPLLMYVPCKGITRQHAELVAAYTGWETLFVQRTDALEFVDTIHMTRKSSVAFSKDFLELLEQSQGFRKLRKHAE